MITPFPRMTNLINGHGKGFNVYWDKPDPGWILLQWDTRGSSSEGNIWSWNETSLGSGDRHLCNGFGKCATSAKTNFLKNNGNLSSDEMGWVVLKQMDYSDEEGQRFCFLNSMTHPGFYVIKDEFGKCIGIPNNSNKNGAEIRAMYCNPSDTGQRWQWHYFLAPARRAKLINGLGKCAAIDPRNRNNIWMHQWNCERIKDEDMLWSWNETSLKSGDRHICSGHGWCIASTSNAAYSIHLIGYYHENEQGQKFNFVDSMTHPGFYIIKNDHGKCISVKGNTNHSGGEIWADNCNPSKAGQNWKWHNVVDIVPSPRALKRLINGLGKCAFVDSSREMNTVGNVMHQWDCNPTKGEAMLWSWNKTSLGSSDRRICNGMGLCISSNANAAWSNHLLVWDHVDEQGQRFSFENSLSYPGFYVIKNDHGKCLSVPENKDRNGAEIWASDCNPSEADQRWKWLN